MKNKSNLLYLSHNLGGVVRVTVVGCDEVVGGVELSVFVPYLGTKNVRYAILLSFHINGIEPSSCGMSRSYLFEYVVKR